MTSPEICRPLEGDLEKAGGVEGSSFPACTSRRGLAAVQLRGYTLVEVLVAASILALGVAAASVLAMSLANTQIANGKMLRALNYQEQAARLYQLGVANGTITNVLPRPTGATVTFVSEELSTTVSGIGEMDYAICRLVYSGGTSLVTSGTADPITNEIAVARPTFR
jgi:prepilin-type N-terminal cleavage/methylation domain-containing protein